MSLLSKLDKRNVAKVLDDTKEGDTVVKIIFLNQDSRDPCCLCFGHVGEILMDLMETISLDKINWETNGLKLPEDEYERLWQTTSDLGDSLTVAEQLEIIFEQDR